MTVVGWIALALFMIIFGFLCMVAGWNICKSCEVGKTIFTHVTLRDQELVTISAALGINAMFPMKHGDMIQVQYLECNVK